MFLRLFTVLILLFTASAPAQDIAGQVLAEMNFARTRPQEYARIVEANADRFGGSDGADSVREAITFLRRARPLPPLTLSQGMSQAALSHALDRGSRGGSGHRGVDGSTPWDRMARFGQRSGYAGENIDYGHRDARGIVLSLIVDHGVRSRAHRANIFGENFRMTGVAVARHARWGTMCVIGYASTFAEAGEPQLAERTIRPFRMERMGKSFF